MEKNYLAGNLYQNTANFYDYDNREIIKDDLDFYVEYANQTNGSILELASGTGRVSLYIAEKTKSRLLIADGISIILAIKSDASAPAMLYINIPSVNGSMYSIDVNFSSFNTVNKR